MAEQKSLSPTEQQFLALNDAYKYFNEILFNGELPGCILNFSRKKNTHGFLAPYRWKKVGEQDFSIHEISLTPTTLYRSPKEIFSTLVHEMVHLWQFEFGSPSRSGYHNKEWSLKMEEVGLIPSRTGKEGGKRTGQQVSHFVEKNGRYEQAFEKMPEQYTLPFTSWEGNVMRRLLDANGGDGKQQKAVTRGRYKTKFTCSNCGDNAWGKPTLQLVCGKCEQPFQTIV